MQKVNGLSYQVGATGIINAEGFVPGEVTAEDFHAEYSKIVTAYNGNRWAMGDLQVLAAECGIHDEELSQVFDPRHASYQTLQNVKSNARYYPPDIRTFRLSFSHYAAARGQGLELEDSINLLKQAEEGEWSRDDVREAKARLQAERGIGLVEPEPETEPEPVEPVRSLAQRKKDSRAAISEETPIATLAQIILRWHGEEKSLDLAGHLTQMIMEPPE